MVENSKLKTIVNRISRQSKPVRLSALTCFICVMTDANMHASRSFGGGAIAVLLSLVSIVNLSQAIPRRSVGRGICLWAWFYLCLAFRLPVHDLPLGAVLCLRATFA